MARRKLRLHLLCRAPVLRLTPCTTYTRAQTTLLFGLRTSGLIVEPQVAASRRAEVDASRRP